MDGSPDLISNVTFAEARKGYDPDEVHNYLLEVEEQVGTLKEMTRTAIERAEAAEARVAEVRRGTGELEQRVAAAQQRAAEAEQRLARAESAPSRSDQTAEAAGILAMAQKTADAALADAESRAAEVTAEADQRAAERLAEAVARADELVDAARREASTRREAELGAMHEELERLGAVRGELQRDIDLLAGFLDRRRGMLRETVDQLGAIIEDPERLRLGSPPPVSDVVVPDAPAPAPASDVGVDEVAVDSADGTRSGSAAAASSGTIALGGAAEVPVGSDPDDVAEREDAAVTAGLDGAGEDSDGSPAEEGSSPDAAVEEDEEYEEYEIVDEHEHELELEEDDSEGPWYQEEGSPTTDDDDDDDRGIPVVTVEDLGDPTQAVPVAELIGNDVDDRSSERGRLFPEADDSSFGDLDDDEDAAMRAFFEGDDEGPDSRSRWGFGRKR